MSPEALTAERAYQDLKEDILRGRFAPGAPLNVHAIAQENGMSISPLRDAFQRMVGERLLVARTSGGFEVFVITEESAADLYRWHAYLLRGAVRAGRSIQRGEDILRSLDRTDRADGEAIVAITAELFYRIGEAARSVEHHLAIRAAGERLTMLRLCESRFDNRKEELRALVSLASVGRVGALQNAVAAYHRRRLRHVAAIVQSLGRTG